MCHPPCACFLIHLLTVGILLCVCAFRPNLSICLLLLRQVYAVRAEAKKRSLPESSLDLFAAGAQGAEALGDLAALTATGLGTVASMFSPW